MAPQTQGRSGALSSVHDPASAGVARASFVRSAQNTAGLLPEPLKPATTLAAGDVIAVIREHGDADQLNLPT